MSRPRVPANGGLVAGRGRRLSIRWRWAWWCAGLVVAAGVVVLGVTLGITDRQLAERAPGRTIAQQPTAMRPPGPGGPGPGGPGGGGAVVTQAEVLAAGRAATDATLRSVARTGGLILAGLALGSVVVGWLVAGRMLRPLSQMTDAARDISEPGAGRRLGLRGPHDELAELADTFDDMLDRLEAAFVAQRAFVSDASHELRTPLAMMRTEIDVALEDPSSSVVDLRTALEGVGEGVRRTSALAESLLHLSKAAVPVELVEHDLAESAAGALAAVAKAGGADLVVGSSLGTAPVRGDPALLDRMVANLVENAVRYNRPNGMLHVTTGVEPGCPPEGSAIGSASGSAAPQAAKEAVLRVSNDGDPLNPADVPELFERFRRGDRSRDRRSGGFGLGLAIVQTVVTAHGGAVRAWARPEGGLAVEVRLPLGEGTPSGWTG